MKKLALPSLVKTLRGSPYGRVLAVVVVLLLLGTASLFFAEKREPLQGVPSGIGSGSRYVKIAPASVLRFEFPDIMEHASAMENLVMPDGLTGDISWDGNTMILKPNVQLLMNKTYVFSMKKEARLEDGSPLQKEMTFVFAVDGPPKVVSRIPAPDSVGIPVNAEITVICDRPMVPLTHVYGKKELQNADWKATIDPPVEGTWAWIGTSTVEFRPNATLEPATKYTVTIPPGMKSVAGDEVIENYSWSFETIRPKVLSTLPDAGSVRAGPNTKITLTFNQEMDLQTILSSLTFTRVNDGTGSTTVVPYHLAFDRVKTMPEKEEENRTTIVVIPNDPLPLNTKYVLRLAKDARATRGMLGTTEDFSLSFRTASTFTVNVEHKSEYGIRFAFNNPYVHENLKQFVTVTPEPEGWGEYDVGKDEWEENIGLGVYPSLKASTTYTFTVKAGLKDQFGQTLSQDFVVPFTTPPLPPRVFIHSDGEFGIFEKDKPPIYYLNALNVSKITVDFAPLTLKEFLSIHALKDGNYEYAPNIAQYANAEHWELPKPSETQNEWKSIPFDLEEKLGKKLQPGMYALTLQAPEHVNYLKRPIVEQQYFSLTNMAITLKYTGKRALVWVVDTTNGAPVGNATVTFLSLRGEAIMTGETDEAGFFETDLPLGKFRHGNNMWEDPRFFVTAEKDGDFSFVGNDWKSGVSPYDFGYDESFLYPDATAYTAETYLYTERPVYRAGQNVEFKGIARLRDSDGVLHPALKDKRSVQVIVTDSQEKEILKSTYELTPYGSFNGEIPISEDASLGTYRINTTILPDVDISDQYNSTFFEVLAYRKPEYKSSITFAKNDYFGGETIAATIKGEYYFGGAMEGATVHWSAFSTDYYFNRYTDGWYSFSNADTWCWWNCERASTFVANGDGVLDQRGEYAVTLPFTLEGKELSQVVSLEASIIDRSNQSVGAWESVPIHTSEIYVGIRPASYGVEPESEAAVDIITVKPYGSPAPDTSVELSLFTRDWNSIRKMGVDGKYYWENEVKDAFVSKKTVQTDRNGKTIGEILVPKGGSYRIVAKTTDAKGRTSEAGTDIYSYSSAYFNWPRSNSDRLETVADKPEYKVGDTAKLIVKSPYQGQGVKALVTVERENILQKFVLDVTSNALPIEIPITEEMIPNAYVSVVIVKARQGETFNNNGLDTGLPAFAMGLEKLRIETKRKEISVEIETDKKKYLPNGRVTVTIRTRNADGAPIPAEVSLSAVDMSVLAITGYHKPDLVRFFYTLRPLGVRTAHMLLYMLERFKPGSKGGGGGQGDAEGRRDNFRDTAYWNPEIVTNEHGEATVSFTLPDNLTTWKLLAVAHTKESTFGAEDEEIIETKQVIIRPVRPRFFVHRDQVRLGAIVHNFTEETQTFTVALNGEGFESAGSKSKRIRVEPDGQAKVEFPVIISRVDRVVLNFAAESATTNALRDEIEETIPVYTFSVPQTVATSGITTDRSEESVYIPSPDRALNLRLDATLSPSLATYLPGGLSYVSEYPYGCSEQILSSLLPHIAIDSLQGFEAFTIVPKNELQKKVVTGVQKLYQNQLGDGGFGYWPESRESSPSLTAYILFGLQKAKDLGYTVDAGVLERGYQYLNRALRRESDPKRPWFMSDELRAEILFVLAEGKQADASALSNLYEKRENLPVYAQAYLLLALQKSGFTATLKERTVRTELQNRARVSPRGIHFEEDDVRTSRWSMNTNERTTALVLLALLRGDPGDALIPRTIRYLLSVREEGHWDTTQSTVYTLLALTEYLEKSKELDADMTALISLNGKKQSSTKFDASNILSRKEVELTNSELAESAFNAVTIEKHGKGTLYYDLALSYVWLADELPPVEEGMSILRTIEPVDSSMDPNTVTTGQNYRVTLTITVPEDRHFVAIESPLATGLEAIDLHLQTSQRSLEKALTRPTYDNWEDWWMSRQSYFTHTEFRDDSVVLFADTLPTGIYKYEYLVRATTPGTFYERPARVWEMYFPENFGQTAGGTLVIDD